MRIENNDIILTSGKSLKVVIKAACEGLKFQPEVRVRDGKASVVLPDGFYEKSGGERDGKVVDGMEAIVRVARALHKEGVGYENFQAATYRTNQRGERVPWMGIWLNTNTGTSAGVGEDWNRVLEGLTNEYLGKGGSAEFLAKLASAPGVAAAQLRVELKKLAPAEQPTTTEAAQPEKVETAVEAF